MAGSREVSGQVPDFLTVQEAAAILRIGRNAAYRLVNRYLDTDGAEGIPAQRLGNKIIRVPRARLEEWQGGPVSGAPSEMQSPHSIALTSSDPEAFEPTDLQPQRRHAAARPRRRNAGQASLPFKA